MASTKVRGITIELGADTSGLSKALKGVNSDIKLTEKQLKDVERLLKLDPANTELLAQKQKLLGDRVAETKDKLNALKEAQKQVAEELQKTGEGQEQYDALQREIIQTENDLKNAEQAASSFNATTAKISATAGNLSSKFGDLADKTKGLSMAAGGALAGLAGLAVKAGKDADELSTLSKQTGVATDELQKMQYASDLIDVDVDTITGSLKKMKKGLDSNADAFEELGVATKQNGQFRDITDIFYDTVEALSQIPNETERDIKAMEIFGKSADDLAGIIDDGGAALKTLGQEAENMGVIISEEDLEKANELNDALDKLKAEILPTITQLGIQIAEAIMPYIPAIQEGIEKVLSALREISPQALTIVTAVLAITAAISPMFTVLSKITGIVSALTSSSGALGGVLGGLSAPILAIVAAVGVLIAAFVSLWRNNEEFRNNITAIWDGLKAKFEAFGQGIVDRLNKMGFEFDNFGEIVKAAWDYICNYLAPVFENAFDAVAAVLGGALDVLMGLFDVFAGLFTGNWEQMWNGVKEIFSGIWDAIVGVLKGAINVIINSINALIGGINKIGFGENTINIPMIPMLAKGGILSSGSAIVGEAGAEILTMQGGQAMVQPLNNGNGSSGSGVVALLEEYLPYLAQQQNIVMDSGALVGAIAPGMNGALGTFATRGSYR